MPLHSVVPVATSTGWAAGVSFPKGAENNTFGRHPESGDANFKARLRYLLAALSKSDPRDDCFEKHDRRL